MRYPKAGKTVSILDTDYILNKIIYRIRTGISSYIDGTARIPGTHQFASVHVFQQLYGADEHGHANKWHKLSIQSQEQGWSTSASHFQEIFEREYFPLITFVNVSGMYENTPQALAVRRRDASVAPTAQLLVLLARTSPIIYTNDQDLWKAGLAPSKKNLNKIADSHKEFDETQSSLEAISNSTFFFVAGAGVVVDSVASAVRVPKWLGRIATIGVIGWGVANSGRRKKVMEVLTPALEHFSFLIQKSENAKIILATGVPPLDSIDSLEQMIAEILVPHSFSLGLLAREIQDELRIKNLPNVPSIEEIRGLVRDSPCFVEPRRFRYRLGSLSLLGQF